MASLLEAFAGEAPTIVHRLREWVNHSADRPCLYYGENDLALSYREFDRLTDQFAASLAEQGVGPGHRVLLYSDNAALAALAMFAAWKLAAVYCPLNPRLPEDMLAFVLKDLAADIAVCDPESLAALRAVGGQDGFPAGILVCSDSRIARPSDRSRPGCIPGPIPGVTCLENIESRKVEPPAPVCKASDVASVIYTSGTTSDPKGVIQSHAWLHALCATQSVWTHPDDVIHCDLPMHHIGGAFSLFARSVWSGASTALWDRFSASQYWQRIRRYGATTALLLDVMTDWLLANPDHPFERENSLSKVHLQPLSPRHHLLARRFGIDFVLAGYGSSEVGNALLGCIDELADDVGTPKNLWRGYSKVEIRKRVRERFGDGAVVSALAEISHGLMGVPSGFYQVELLPDESSQRETGSTGRLRLTPRIEGVLFHGYLNRRDADSGRAGGSHYLAPDIAKKDRHGRFYFVERTEGQLRVRGENVSAAAVESVFLGHPAIQQCIAIGVPALQGYENDIVLFVQPVPGQLLDPEDLLQWSRERLPAYMQPAWCRLVAEMPLTSTMKIDRGALRAQASREVGDDTSP